MSGHNKWSKIKHKKAATDAKKSKEFTKLIKLITVEAKKSNGDMSPGLKMAVDKAKKANMPNDNIERAIKKAGASKENLNEVLYEAYGPSGVGIIITALTDNSNRTSAEIKHILAKNNCTLGTQGSVIWNFTKEHDQWVAQNKMKLDDAGEEKLSLLIETLEEDDDVQDIYTSSEAYD